MNSDEKRSRFTRVLCSHCNAERITLDAQATLDYRKFCPGCAHQGARPVEQCQCATCGMMRAGLPAFVPAPSVRS